MRLLVELEIEMKDEPSSEAFPMSVVARIEDILRDNTRRDSLSYWLVTRVRNVGQDLTI